MPNTPNRNLPYPDDTGKLTAGADDIGALALAVDAELIKVIPVAGGGTGATARDAAKVNLGITYGPGDPSGGIPGDVHFKIVG